jgi:hypothetical protein
MEAELAHGDAIAALRTFDRCERIVMAEFGASPSPRTIDVAERARRPRPQTRSKTDSIS